MKVSKVAILGLGVAGSFLAKRLHGLVDLVLYEPTPYYNYPCGEAIPREALAVAPCLKKYIIRRIRKVVISVEGEKKVFDYSEDMGFIIDKKAFINDIRVKLEKEYHVIRRYARVTEAIKEADFVIDARGSFTPYASGCKCISAVQGFTYNEIGFPSDTIYMYFDRQHLGYFWIFPSVGNKLNVGFGATCRSCPNIINEFLRILRQHGFTRIIGYQGKKIAINDPSISIGAAALSIGEAGGFVVPFTGEGIRPALESAAVAADAIIKAKDRLDVSYHFKKSGIIKRYSKHHRLFDVIRAVGPKACKFLLKLTGEDLRKLLHGDISIRFYLKALKSLL